MFNQCPVQTMGVLENFQEHPRHVRMAAEATMDKADLLNSENVCELRTASQDWNKSLLRGAALMNGDDNVAGADRFDLDFSLKPMIALNRVSSQAGGQPSISYTKTGAIRVSVKIVKTSDEANPQAGRLYTKPMDLGFLLPGETKGYNQRVSQGAANGASRGHEVVLHRFNVEEAEEEDSSVDDLEELLKK